MKTSSVIYHLTYRRQRYEIRFDSAKVTSEEHGVTATRNGWSQLVQGPHPKGTGIGSLRWDPSRNRRPSEGNARMFLRWFFEHFENGVSPL